MPELTVIVDHAYLDEIKRMLSKRYGATVFQIIHSEWGGPVDLGRLRSYYEGEYRQDENVQALIVSGLLPLPAGEMSEDDWGEFASDLELYQQNGDLQLFQPSPRVGHDYRRWFQQPDVTPPEQDGEK